MNRSQVYSGMRTGMGILKQGNLGVPILLLVILGMMTLPVPPFLLDVFFTFNIALSIVVLLVGVYAMRPLDFAAFPTILLVATLMRLALNVASTRVVYCTVMTVAMRQVRLFRPLVTWLLVVTMLLVQ